MPRSLTHHREARIEHSFDTVVNVTADPPNLEILPHAPADTDVAKWVVAWKVVHFRTRDTWQVGVLRAWILLHDGWWVAHIDHAGGGMHNDWQQSTWVVYDTALVVPVNPVPDGY